MTTTTKPRRTTASPATRVALGILAVAAAVALCAYILPGGVLLREASTAWAARASLAVEAVRFVPGRDGVPREAGAAGYRLLHGKGTVAWRRIGHEVRGSRTLAGSAQERRDAGAADDPFAVLQALFAAMDERESMDAFVAGLGIRVDLSSYRRLGDVVCYALGAGPQDDHVPQLWITQNRLLPVRLQWRNTRGDLFTVRLEGYDDPRMEGRFPLTVRYEREGTLLEEHRVERTRLRPPTDSEMLSIPRK